MGGGGVGVGGWVVRGDSQPKYQQDITQKCLIKLFLIN